MNRSDLPGDVQSDLHELAVIRAHLHELGGAPVALINNKPAFAVKRLIAKRVQDDYRDGLLASLQGAAASLELSDPCLVARNTARFVAHELLTLSLMTPAEALATAPAPERFAERWEAQRGCMEDEGVSEDNARTLYALGFADARIGSKAAAWERAALDAERKLRDVKRQLCEALADEDTTAQDVAESRGWGDVFDAEVEP